jgi:hypothetical protein
VILRINGKDVPRDRFISELVPRIGADGKCKQLTAGRI